MNRMIKPLLAASQILLLAGCPGWGSGDTMDTSTLKCSSQGCLTCDKYGACYQYLCDNTSQCPAGYGCTVDNACMPQSGLLGGGGSGGYSCTSDAQCPTGQVCEAHSCIDSTPVPTIQCTVSADCGADRICQAGKCIADPGTPNKPPEPACKADLDCGAGKACNQGACEAKVFPVRPEGTCQFKLDCGQAGTCVNTKCYFPPAQGLCPPSSKDVAGLCMPNTDALGECKFNADCGDNALCKNATCVALCAEDAACKKGNYCGAAGLCVLDDRPVLQCLADADCPASARSCVDGRCLADCQVTTAGSGMCSLASEECTFGFCMPTASCFLEADCTAGGSDLDCINGQCDALLTADKGQADEPPPADAPPTDAPPAP